MNSCAHAANKQRGKNSDSDLRIFPSCEPETDSECCNEYSGSNQRMRSRAVAMQECACAAETGNPIRVGRQARDEKHRCRHPRYFVKPGASESDRGERVGHWFHEKGVNLIGADLGCRPRLEPARNMVRAA